MISGLVAGRHALVPLTVRGPHGQEVEIEFVLDTGFAGFLALPPATVAALALPFAYRMPAYLADGSHVILHAYHAVVLWDGMEISVEVLAAGGEALLGTSLLDGYEVNIQFADGGSVTIDRL
jgi:clan AA aspartic protease